MEELQRLQQDMLHAALSQQTILARHQEQQAMFKSAWDKAAEGEDVAHLVPPTDGQDIPPPGLHAHHGASDSTAAGAAAGSSSTSSVALNASNAFTGDFSATVAQLAQAGSMANLQGGSEQQQALLQMLIQQQQGSFSGLNSTATNGTNQTNAAAAAQGLGNGPALGMGLALPGSGNGASSGGEGSAATADGSTGNALEELSESDAAQAAIHQLAAHHAHAAAVACAQRGGSKDDQTRDAHAAYLAVLTAQQQVNAGAGDVSGGGSGWHLDAGSDSGDGMLHLDLSSGILSGLGNNSGSSSSSHPRSSRKSQSRSSSATKRPRDDPMPFGPTGPDGKRAKVASLPVRPSNWTPAQDKRLCDIVSVHGAREWKKIAARMKDPVPDSSSSSSSGPVSSSNDNSSSSSSSSADATAGDNIPSVIDDGSGDFTDVQCLHRWNKVLKPGLKKGPWTDEEDAVVTEAVATHGAHKV